MDEQGIKNEMRLWVLEILVCNIFAMISASDRDPVELLKETREQMTAGVSQRGFPGLDDPAMSDLYSAELEAAAKRLMDMVDAQISVLLQQRGRGS